MLGTGTTLSDRYVLGDRLGGGGMGEVWRADDTVLGRTVAVKVLMPALSEDPTFAQRFQNEARAMATLSHPGVVDVYDYGTCDADGRRVSFLVMEYVQGESLDRVLRRGPLPAEATVRLVTEVADALAAAHAQGIVHRDVKPANLMVRPDGSVVLTDFGIAHSASAGQLTATGAMLCSAGYCAPEMATAGDVTPAVDIYALGVVAYECLSGQLPFHGDTPVQIIFKHLNAPVPRLPAEVPPGLRQVVERALEKTPEARWQTAPRMGEAARMALTAPHSRSAPRRPGVTRAAVTVVAAVAISLAVAGFVWLRPAGTASSEEVQPPAVDSTELPLTPASSPVARDLQSPPASVKRTASPRPTRSVTVTAPATPTATAVPTTTTRPRTTPPTTPATETTPPPEQTPDPPTPGPAEPTSDTPPSDRPTGQLDCVRAPCS